MSSAFAKVLNDDHKTGIIRTPVFGKNYQSTPAIYLFIENNKL